MRQVRDIQLASFQAKDVKATPSSIIAHGPIDVFCFRELLERNAEIAALNPRYSIFYRGQAGRFFDRNEIDSILPSIYRGARRGHSKELKLRFDKLDRAVALLRRASQDGLIPNFDSKLARTVNCWALIQHYELCDTPLIDVTQSLRVACAFALQGDGQGEANDRGPIVYDIALPFATGPLTLDDNEALYLMKLDALMPSFALRPFVQEGYLVGDELISRDVDDIARSNLRRRVIASFRLRGRHEQWLNDIGVNADSLMISDDRISSIISKFKQEIEEPPNDDNDNEAVVSMANALTLFAEQTKSIYASSRVD